MEKLIIIVFKTSDTYIIYVSWKNNYYWVAINYFQFCLPRDDVLYYKTLTCRFDPNLH